MKKYFENNWFLLFLLIPFFKPICLQYYTGLHAAETVFKVWKIISAGTALALFAGHLKEEPGQWKFAAAVASVGLIIVCSTLYHRGNMVRALTDMISMTSYTAILLMAVYYDRDRVIGLLSRLLEVLIVLNFISIILAPGGLSADLYYNHDNPLYFMVTDNGGAILYIFAMLVFMLDSIGREAKVSVRTKILLVICALSAVVSGSATAVVAAVLYMGVLGFMEWKKTIKIRWPWLMLVLYLAACFYLLSTRNNPLIGLIVEKIFHRPANFNNRYVIWEAAKEMIRQRPLIGYGRITGDYVYVPMFSQYFGSHNYILELMLQGGVFAVGAFFAVIILALKKLYSVPCDRTTNCLVAALFLMLVAMMMEVNVHSVYIFGVLILCYVRPALAKEAEG